MSDYHGLVVMRPFVLMFEVSKRVSLGIGILSMSAALASATTMSVGPEKQFKNPSEAAAVAQDGDTVEIYPGKYIDCAVWRANDLKIVGKGPADDIVIAEKTCDGKGIFITVGKNIVVRNLTLARARVPDANGAGIRVEGANLKIDGVKFRNNQNGILTAPDAASVLEIVNSEFVENGTCENEAGCAHGIYINHIGKVIVRDSKFFASKEGHHIKSRAYETEILNTEIKDGEKGNASYLIDVPNGGGVHIENCTMQKGANSSNRTAAISIGAEGVTQKTPQLIIKGNTFVNSGRPTTFVFNVTATPAILTGNSITGEVRTLRGDGEVR
jgi:hypothetical protein